LSSRVGIVVPTLGQRSGYLEQCLGSIRAAGNAYILLVSPSGFDVSELRRADLIDAQVNDPGTGLPEAINLGIKSLPEYVAFVNWLGDDDLLAQNSIEVTESTLQADPKCVMVYGSCEYIDADGDPLWTNTSGQWAVPLLRFGPDLIPQPGALFRRDTFEKVGGLSPDFAWAFDFDLFIRLSKAGSLKFISKTLSQFRWHPESLSVEHRMSSVKEANQVRVSHLPAALRPISFLWEYPVRHATLAAGKRLTMRARTKAPSK
jgi:GT2 family glycosyltransferase